jgi:hypothetical protein
MENEPGIKSVDPGFAGPFLGGGKAAAHQLVRYGEDTGRGLSQPKAENTRNDREDKEGLHRMGEGMAAEMCECQILGVITHRCQKAMDPAR